MRLSENFTLQEMTRSSTALRMGIDNTPPRHMIARLTTLAARMQGVRAVCGDNIVHVNSAWRGAELNEAIGGAANSQHVEAEAVDFIIPDFGSPFEVCQAIAESDLPFDQLIHERRRWVHISFHTREEPGREPRRDILTLPPGERFYIRGLSD